MEDYFYTYIYLDPRKPGLYSCGDYVFEYEPFYVGKGKDDRWICHLNEAIGNRLIHWVDNKHRYYKIRKILNEGFEIIKSVHIIKAEENLTDQNALDLETWLIWAIGRKDLKTGPLTNHSDGGDGPSGRIVSLETRQKLSDTLKGRTAWNKGLVGVYITSYETRKKLSDHLKGREFSDDHKINISKSKTGILNPMYGKTFSEETLIRLSEKAKGRVPWNKGKSGLYTHSLEMRDRVSKSKMGVLNPMYGKSPSAETRQKMSDSIKGENHPNFGKRFTDERKYKMSRSHKNQIPWNKGLKKEQYHLYKKDQ